jgi:hypothetical protein
MKVVFHFSKIFQLFWLISSYFTTCPGGGGAGYVVGKIKNKANSAQLELESLFELNRVVLNENRLELC